MFRVVENPYGEGYTSEVQAPTLDQDLLEDLTLSPSAPPAPLVDQAFQTKLLEDVDEPKSIHEGCSKDQLTYSGPEQSETRAKATHQAQLVADQIPRLEHHARWEAVDLHRSRPTPTDSGQEPQKLIKAVSLGKHFVQELRNTQEAGTSTVTCESIKVGVSKTIQGSVEGAWLMDAAEHLASLATKADQAEQELAANLYTDLVSAEDDIQAGRRSGPMLATGTNGHFALYQDVEGGCPERLAVTNHVGLIGQSVTDQIPLIKVDPNRPRTQSGLPASGASKNRQST